MAEASQHHARVHPAKARYYQVHLDRDLFRGEGAFASTDAMSLDATRHLYSARIDPRRRTPGIGIYTHKLDHWGLIYDQPVVLMQRQAGVAIEGMVRQQSSGDIERLAVDTHGFTYFGMATAKVLGFDLCPRLKGLRRQKLHVPKGTAIVDPRPACRAGYHPAAN